MPAKRPGVETRTGADGTKTYRVRWRPRGGRGTRQQSHTFTRLVAANSLHDELTVGGWVCYCRKHAPPGDPIAPMPTGLRPAADRVAAPVVSGPLFAPWALRAAANITGVGDGYRRDVIRDIRLHLQTFADRPLSALTTTDVKEWIRGCETGTHPWLHRKDCSWRKVWEAEKVKAAPGGPTLAELLARLLEAAGGVAPCSMPAPEDDEEDDRPACSPTRSPVTVQRILAEVGGLVQAGQKDGEVVRNVFRGHRLAREDTGQDHDHGKTYLTHAEWVLLCSCLPEGVYRDLCTVLVGTGMRWGEASALAVGAVDVLADPPRLHVARAWKKDGKAGFVLGTPKSRRSRRTLTYSTAVRDALLPHVAGKTDDEFVFTTPRGRPLLHSNFYGKVWLPAVEKARKAGLTKSPRLHDLRHTYVSWLIAGNVPVAVISRRLGHQSINLTINTYGHILPELDTQAVAALERAMPVKEPAPGDNGPASPGSGSSASQT